jgi:gas vesicle protein
MHNTGKVLFAALVGAAAGAVASSSTKSLKEEAKKLTDRLEKLDPKAVEPWVGTYQNDQLGEMDLRLEDDKLVADAGEFSSEVRPMRSEQTGELVYVTIDPPIIGAELRLGDDDGQKQVEFGQGVVSYTFTR